MDANKRCDFLLVIESKNGNPNGDPDLEGRPRCDLDSSGLITPTSVKRKVRDMWYESGESIWVHPKNFLNDEKSKVVKESGVDPKDSFGIDKAMCERYLDVRAFGGVTNIGVEKGIGVRGAIQIGIGSTSSPIDIQGITITRCCGLDSKNDDGKKVKDREMGRSSFVSYGLYTMQGVFTPVCARNNGFTKEDLDNFFDVLPYVYSENPSASRGGVRIRAIYVFEHPSERGIIPEYLLMEAVYPKLKVEVPQSADDFEWVDLNELQKNLGERATVSNLVPQSL